ncbi:MAG TPA: hypothetical protein VGP79_18260 [Bryobacteraceae bacterium]|nr:hypothetical protein [Bryobacteraceae bacterium]
MTGTFEGPFRALVRHFFGRFFDNEFVARDSEMQVTVTRILAMLAVPGLLLPMFRFTTYTGLEGYPLEVWNPTLWFDRCFFFSFSMVVMGAVTVLEWDTLFPDRRDYAALIPLPLPLRSIFLAKVAALAIFVVAFTLVVNLSSTVTFPIISLRGNFRGLLRGIAIHGLTVLAASTFIFGFLVALEGVLLNILSFAWFRKVSVLMQCVLVFALLSVFFLFPNVASALPRLKAVDSPWLYAYPPAWFLGMNEVLLGSRDPVFLKLAAVAWRSLGGALLISAVAYTVAYRRQVKRTLETLEGGDGGRTRVNEWLARIADRVAPNAVERGALAFIGKTAARSAKHRIFLAAYVGVGCAIVLQALIGIRLKQASLSIPLVLSFFVLSGLRYIFTIPAELPANWIFRVTESDQRGRALDGARRAMLWFGVVPLFTLLAPFYFVLWTPFVAIAHLLFSVTCSVLLIEVLMFDFWKIPFTCSYPAGKANVTVMWIFYWIAFTSYAYAMASLEAWMLLRPWRLVIFYAAAGALWYLLQRHFRRSERVFTLIFDDVAEPIVRTLGLSELGWITQADTRPANPGRLLHGTRRSSASHISRAE